MKSLSKNLIVNKKRKAHQKDFFGPPVEKHLSSGLDSRSKGRGFESRLNQLYMKMASKPSRLMYPILVHIQKRNKNIVSVIGHTKNNFSVI